MKQIERYRGCLLGLAIGDAIGTTAEFKHRGTFSPVTDMVGGGVFSLDPGEWTDDTSMALCLATSLIKCNGFDAKDQMDRYYRWWTEGYLSSNGKCFDIGNTVKHSLSSYNYTGDPYSGNTDPRSAGNGSIMRLAPIPMFYCNDPVSLAEYSALSSITTHGATESVEACQLFSVLIVRALQGMSKEQILQPSGLVFDSPSIQAIDRGEYRGKVVDDIRGSGYVVESLEAALWCFSVTDSYREAILKAVNLGYDADTTAAVCGQIAGAFYGMSGIPEEWVQKVVMNDEIVVMADQLMKAAQHTN